MSSQLGHNREGVWAVILVPPKPGARTHQLTVRARTVVAAGTLMLALIAGAATSTGETSSIATSTAERLAESQRTVVALLDSVHALREILAHERALRTPPRNMLMPVDGYISSRFSTSRLHPLLEVFRPHRGVDIAAPVGTRIIAPAPGRVRFVGKRPGHGLTIELQHTGGVVTRYGHCQEVLARVGQEVNTGDAIATVGNTGLATGPHLHFEVLARGISVDPVKFLAASQDSSYAE